MATDSRPQADYFADLYELASDPGTSLEAKVERAIEIGCDRLDVENGVLSYTGDGAYEVVETNIQTGEYTAGSVNDLETTWCRHVVDGGSLLGFGDVTETEYADDVARAETGLHCYIGAPVVVDNETYGTLCYSSTEPRSTDFDEGERQFVRLLARWISYEVERDRHYRELEAQNERLDHFAGVVSHDLRNPLSAATGFTEMAMAEATGEQLDFLESATEALGRMETLIEDLLALAREGMAVGHREAVSVAATARDAWALVDTGDATLSIESSQSVYANPSRFQQLFENLFRNAVEHGGSGVTVRVSDTQDGFVVADDGPGLPTEIADQLFSGARVSNDQRVGLGLLIVERIVSGHDWTANVSSSEAGTKFEFHGVSTA